MEKQIEYKADTHEYLYGNEKFNSVTELASLYSKLNTEWLQAHPEYAARGTLVHDELSKYVDGKLGIADMQYELSKQIAAYLVPSKSMKSEVIVYNTEHHYAGTADVIKVNGLLVESILDLSEGVHQVVHLIVLLVDDSLKRINLILSFVLFLIAILVTGDQHSHAKNG